jgi:nitrogen fixation NifU-like protein
VSDAAALYQALVVEHGNAPRRQGPLEGATHQAKVTNPLCGDRVVLRLVVADGVVQALRFEARGCLLAIASASILGDLVEGQPVARALELAATLADLVGEGPAPTELGPLELLRPVRGFPARAGCVGLAWRALQGALSE